MTLRDEYLILPRSLGNPMVHGAPGDVQDGVERESLCHCLPKKGRMRGLQRRADRRPGHRAAIITWDSAWLNPRPVIGCRPKAYKNYPPAPILPTGTSAIILFLFSSLSSSSYTSSKWLRSSLSVVVSQVSLLHTLCLSGEPMSFSWTSSRMCSRRFIVCTLFTKVRCRFMGGNSTKATSGINGAGTQTQQELGIPDSAKQFFADTKKSVRLLLSPN